MASMNAKRRRESSLSDQQDLARGPYGGLQRQYGDTYVSGSANVHFGDRIYFDNNATSLKQEAQRFQDSLSFPQMHERYESLREATDGTYCWIFESKTSEACDTSQRQQMRKFQYWLRDSPGMFWVSGKPGSGKSTLMKYLVEHAISELSGHASHLSAVFSFFFWIGGSDLQRNKIGCMRSLLWQALQAPSTMNLAMRVCQPQFKGVWTERILRTTLSALLEHLDSSIVIFLDGLDESNDHDEILDFLHVFRSAPKIKLCISSRPETSLIGSLESLPSLRLQDVNEKDIRHVIPF